jgi:hypothetical protein
MAIRTSTLDAVNQMLSCVGGAAVVSLDNDNPEIAAAVAILEETTRAVLSEGWNFNTEQDYPFTPDTNEEILIPDNLLSFAVSFEKHGSDYLIVERLGKFYNKLAHTYKFSEIIYADVVFGFTFEECPQPFKEYITARASRVYASRLVASKEQVELISQDEAVCRSLCITYDTDTGKPTVFGLETGQSTYISYLPFRTLAR